MAGGSSTGAVPAVGVPGNMVSSWNQDLNCGGRSTPTVTGSSPTTTPGYVLTLNGQSLDSDLEAAVFSEAAESRIG